MMRHYLKRVVYFLVALGVSLAFAGSYDDFFTAIKRDDAGAVTALLQRGFDPNTPNPQGLDGLYLALREGSVKAAQALVDWPKTQIETRTPQDESPLMMAALRGQAEIVRKLVARGADVNKTGWTALHYAATGGHLAIMQMLLDESAYIDAESPNGTTPLMMAAMYGTPAAVKLLLEAGADPTLKNQLGLSALDFANRGNRKDAAELIAASIQAWRLKSKQPQ
jgi:ankyrin repeat protein